MNLNINNLSIVISKILRVFLIVVFFFLFVSTWFLDSTNTFYTFIIFINLYLVYVFKNNQGFLLLYIFCLFYTLSLIPYYCFNIDISAWKDFNEKKYYNIVLKIYGIFLISPLFFIKKRTFKFVNCLAIPRNPNIIGFFTTCIVCLIIIVLGQSGSNIFESGGYGNSINESSKSTIYEYFIIFFLLAYYYSNQKRNQLIILSGLLFTYVIKSLLFGGRIEVIQLLLLCYFILIVNHKLVIKPSRIIIGCLIFYYLNQIFSSIRSNPIPLLQGDYISYLNPFESYADSSINYISSNEGDVFQSSVRLIGLIENGLLDTITRIKALMGFFLSIVVPSSWLPEEASLITYKKDIYNSGGGGLIAVYFYAFLGWLGPFIISAYLFWIYRLTAIYKNIYLKFYTLMVFSTFPRWFAYNPIILFKLCLWVIPIVFVSNMVFNTLKMIIKKTEFK